MGKWSDGLNKAQLEAAKCLEGPLLVLAGAGSGKTKTMTHRIAHLVESGVPGSQILAVTFTNKAAAEMSERIKALVGSNSGVSASTFHSFGFKVLKRFGSLLGYRQGLVVADEAETKKRAKAALSAFYAEKVRDEEELKAAEKEVPEVASVFLSAVSKLKDEVCLPSGVYEGTGSGKEAQVLLKTAADLMSDESSFVFFTAGDVEKIYASYQRGLLEDNAVDFDDLIAIPVLLIKGKEEARRYYRKTFRYFCVDEYQDTSAAQYELMELLSAGTGNLCVVGDDYQSIYAFRGAVIGNILSFPKKHPGCKVVVLGENYRSTANIVDGAAGVVANNPGQYRKDLVSQNEAGERIKVSAFPTGTDEANFVAREVRNALDSGEAASEIAVLYRSNALSREIEKAMLSMRVPYVVHGGVNFYDRREVKLAVAYAQIACGAQNTELLASVANAPKRKLGEKSVADLVAYAKEHAHLGSLASRVEALAAEQPKFASLAEVLKDLETAAAEMLPSAFVREVVSRADLVRAAREFSKDEEDFGNRVQNVLEVSSAAAAYDSAEGSFLERSRTWLEEVSLVPDQCEEEEEKVSLMTMHKSKGLEFSRVYVVAAEEPKISRPDEEEEERRLFYVAMTRAKKHLSISSARKRFVYGSPQSCSELKFVSEIPECNMERAGKSRGRDLWGCERDEEDWYRWY